MPAERTIEQIYQECKIAAGKTDSLSEWNSLRYNDYDIWLEDRRKCQTDLFWFSIDILGYDLVEFHRFVTTEFFIQKDPETPLHKLSPKKSRLILYPRGSFKSSLDEADTVQWIICYPNIRIGLMTATDGLGSAFVSKIKSFFQVPEETKLTRFQMLFFEHCVPATKREAAEIFITRARTKKYPQATLESISLMESTSGYHYDVGKFDDVVSNRNSGPGTTPEARRTIYEQMRFASALIDPFGYKLYLGTPYNDDDAYYYLQAKTLNLVVLRKPAVIIKPHVKIKPFLELTDDDVELLFPEDRKGVPRLTLGYLKGEYNADEYVFSCNYLLDPLRNRRVNFTEDLLRSQTIDNAAGLPQSGSYRLFSAWDFADSTGRNSDFSVGVVGMLDCFGRMYIVDMARGKYSPSELSYQVAYQANKWKVEKIYIEKSPGADFLQNDIMRELTRVGYVECPLPEFFPVDNQRGAKEKRAEQLETYLRNKILWFGGIYLGNQMLDIVNEFINFKPASKRKDDIIDAIAHLCRIIPASPTIPETESERTQVVWDILAKKQLHDMYFGVRENETPLPPPNLPLNVFDGEYGQAPLICQHCGFYPCIGK